MNVVQTAIIDFPPLYNLYRKEGKNLKCTTELRNSEKINDVIFFSWIFINDNIRWHTENYIIYYFQSDGSRFGANLTAIWELRKQDARRWDKNSKIWSHACKNGRIRALGMSYTYIVLVLFRVYASKKKISYFVFIKINSKHYHQVTYCISVILCYSFLDKSWQCLEHWIFVSKHFVQYIGAIHKCLEVKYVYNSSM